MSMIPLKPGLRLQFVMIPGFITFVLMTNFSALGQDRFNELTHVLESKKQSLGRNVCMLVFKDNHLLYERNIGSFTRDTPVPIASCSKWLTAALVATFFDEGKISPGDTIGKFLPVFSRHGKGNITICQCISHTSGIEGGQITLRTLLESRKYGSLAEEVAAFAEKPVSGKPGEVFIYGNIGLNITGRILEVVTHKDFETLFQERIAKTLGMNHTTFMKGNAVNPSGGATSTASDYLNFLQMILQKGEFRGKQIIRPETVTLMQQSHTAGKKVIYSPVEAANFEYGWGEWVLEKDKAGKSIVVSSPGLFGTFPWIDLKRNYAAIVLVKNIHFKNRQKNYREIREAVDASFK